MVYIHKLKKEIFPLYLKPEEEELFSSWICRLSNNHEVKTNTLIGNYFGRDFQLWNRDIDVFAPNSIGVYLERHTPLDRDAIDRMFLKSLEGYAFEGYTNTSSISNILPVGIVHRVRKKFGQQCCTRCLAKPIPYYKVRWRLVTSVICSECEHILIDRCFNCNSPIVFFRINMKTRTNTSTMDFRPLHYCSFCNADLREYSPTRKPTTEELAYQKFIDSTIENGFNSITQYSFTYINMLLHLASRLRSGSKINRIRDVTVGLGLIPTPAQTRIPEIRFWSIEDRLTMLPLVYRIMEDYPNTLHKLLQKGNVKKSYIKKENSDLPFWFETLLHD